MSKQTSLLTSHLLEKLKQFGDRNVFIEGKLDEALFNLAGFAKTLLKMQMELKHGKVEN